MSEKIRFQMRISPETDSKIKKAMEVDNCQSQNEFVEKALQFYCGYVSASNSLEVLPPLLASAIRGSIQDTENRIALYYGQHVIYCGIGAYSAHHTIKNMVYEALGL